MNKRLLGHTGIKVSEIAFGGVEIGLPQGIGIKSKADMPSRSESIRLLHSAIASGINFFDTARMYGASESIMRLFMIGEIKQSLAPNAGIQGTRPEHCFLPVN